MGAQTAVLGPTHGPRSSDVDYKAGSRSRRGSRRSQQFVTRTVARTRRPVQAMSSMFIAPTASMLHDHAGGGDRLTHRAASVAAQLRPVPRGELRPRHRVQTAHDVGRSGRTCSPQSADHHIQVDELPDGRRGQRGGVHDGPPDAGGPVGPAPWAAGRCIPPRHGVPPRPQEAHGPGRPKAVTCDASAASALEGAVGRGTPQGRQAPRRRRSISGSRPARSMSAN
jgi:hypothetical protein